MLFKTYNSYHFFRANQQKDNFKFYLWTQQDFHVNRRDRHIFRAMKMRLHGIVWLG